MKRNNTRSTKQRRAILKIIQETDVHPNADWIFQQAKERLDNICRSTIYRNLSVLLSEGKIIRLETDGGGEARFDGNVRPHAHLVCKECGEIVDLMDVDINVNVNSIKCKTDYSIRSVNLMIYGVCPKCQACNIKK